MVLALAQHTDNPSSTPSVVVIRLTMSPIGIDLDPGPIKQFKAYIYTTLKLGPSLLIIEIHVTIFNQSEICNFCVALIYAVISLVYMLMVGEQWSI